MIVIDKELCVACGECVDDCPGNIIKIRDGVAKALFPCIECGHCVAVCPQHAVSIPGTDMEDVEEYDKDTFHVSPEQLLHSMKFRRSIRRFTKEVPEKAVLEEILEAGRYTATAKNMQDCTFHLICDKMDEFKSLLWKEIPGIIEALKDTEPAVAKVFRRFYKSREQDHEKDNFLFQAPVFLVITSKSSMDGGLAAANIENMALAEGLGTLYSGYMMRVIQASPVLQEWLETGDKTVSACMLLGYPDVRYRRTAPRKKADILWK